MRGLLASVLGGVSKGVGQVATDQIAENSRKALMEAEEQMRDRLAEAAEGRAETRNIAAEERRLKNIPIEAEATAASDEAIMARRYAEGSNYTGLIRQQTAANETPAQKALRESAERTDAFEEEQRGLRRKLAEAQTEEERNEYTRQLNALTGTFGQNSRLDPRVEAELEYIQSEINMYQKDLSSAIENGYTSEDQVVKDIEAKLAPLRLDAQRLLGRSSVDNDPLGLF